MARTYYLSATDSALTGGVVFNKNETLVAEAAGSITVAVTNSATEASFGYTKPNEPGISTFTSGTITVNVNVTTASSSVYLAVQLERINSSGTVQESKTISAENNISTTGIKTFTFSSLTWSAGSSTDRLRIRYQFRSTNSHGGAVSVAIETGGSSTSIVTPFPTLTPTVRTLGQYADDFSTITPVGTSTTDGVTTYVNLNSEYTSGVVGNQDILKAEVQNTSTSFTNTANITERTRSQSMTAVSHGNRGANLIYDKKNKRYIFFGGYDGTTRYNEAWEQPADRPGMPWRKLSPTGTPPTAKNLAGATYVRGTATSGGADKAFMVIWGGTTGSDLSEMHALDVSTPGGESWTTVTQTNTPTAMSYITRQMAAIPVSGDASQNYVYMFGGWPGATRVNTLWRGTFDVDSPGSLTWTVLLADGAAGSPSARTGAVIDYKSSTGKLFLFGGYNGTTYLSDFWSYDIAGNAWTQITPSGTAPAGREFSSGGYDAVNNRFFYAAGFQGTQASAYNDVGYISDLDGSPAYVQLRANSTTDQAFAGNVYTANTINTDLNYLVLRGMETVDSTERYQYAIDMTEASSVVYGLSQGEYLTSRDANASIWNSDRSEWVIVGGFADMYDSATIVTGSHVGDIWAYNQSNNTWRYTNKGFKTLPPMEGIAGVYDSTRSRVIVFGGLNGGSQNSNEVWALTADSLGNYTASKLNPTGTPPSPRWLSVGIFDATNNRAIFTMGGDASTAYNQVWELSFSSSADGVWTLRTPTGTAPTAVLGPGVFNKTSNTRMYLYGGATDAALTTVSSQLVYLDYSTTSGAWVTPTSSGGTARRTPNYAYDATNDQLIIWGGFDGTNVLQSLQYFSLSGTTWASATPTGGPAARRTSMSSFISGKLYIFGGRPSTGTWYNDTWELTPNYSTPNSSTWAEKAPAVYTPFYSRFTSGTSGTSYHWQVWGTESSTDGTKVSYGGNAETASDFTIGSGVSSYTRSHTTDSNKRKAVNDTHTTDSLKRKANTLTHTTDSLKRTSSNKTHTTDTLKRKQATLTHTTSANKRLAVTKTHTTDASKKVSGLLKTHTTNTLIRKQGTASHTTDANKKVASLTRTHTTDSLKKKGGLTLTHTTDSYLRTGIQTLTVAHTTDALKRVQVTKTHTADALKRKASTQTHTTSSVLRKSGTKTHTTDSFKHIQATRTHTTDALKHVQVTKTHTTDALKRIQSVKTHATDAIKRKGNTLSHTTDTVKRTTNTLSHTTDSLRHKQVTVSHTTDALARKSITLTQTTDSFLRKSVSKTHTTDANKKKAGLTLSHTTSANKRLATTKTHTTDALKRTSSTVNHTTSAVLRKSSTLSHSTDSFLRVSKTISHTTSANKKKAQTVAHTTNSNLRKATTVLHTTDSNKRKANLTLSHTTDALKRSSNSVSHTTSAVTHKQFTKTHTTDALVRSKHTLSHTTDSFLFSQSAVSHTTDANKKKAGNSLSHATDSLIRTQGALSHTTDALRRLTSSKGHTTDSLVRKSGTHTHTTSSVLRKQVTLTHATDANKRKANVVVHTTDTLKRTQNSKFHTTDALKKTRNSLTHTTNALIRSAVSLTHTVDSLLRKRLAISHTTDTNTRKALTKTHTTDALKRTQNILSHTTDTDIRRTNTKVHTTDAFTHRSLTTSHTTDANKKKTITVVHTTDSFIHGANQLSHTTDSNKRVASIKRHHLTDANRHTANTVAHSTSSAIRKALSLSHTTDTLARKLTQLVHTTDSLLRSKRTVSHATDANIKKANSKYHTTNTLKRSRTTASHLTDAVLRTTSSISHTTDANKSVLSANTRVHTTDSLLRKVVVVTHTTDALKRISTTVSHFTDALLVRRTVVSHTTSSVIRKLFSLAQFTDANKRKADTVYHTTNANKRKLTQIVHSTDALLKQRYVITHSTDAQLRTTIVVSHATDANKRGTSEVTHTTDSSLSSASIVFHTTDSALYTLLGRKWVLINGQWVNAMVFYPVNGNWVQAEVYYKDSNGNWIEAL